MERTSSAMSGNLLRSRSARWGHLRALGLPRQVALLGLRAATKRQAAVSVGLGGFDPGKFLQTQFLD